MLPKARPKITEAEVIQILEKFSKCHPDEQVILIGIRGYYLDSMGKKAENDRGIYDDALIWYIKGQGIMAFNGNCDASKYRKGFGFGKEKGMASLDVGTWRYTMGTHYGSVPHKAFRQAKPVTVTRDGTKGNYKDTGMFGINIHRGGVNSTSSLGCQTIPPSQWDMFRDVGYNALKERGITEFSYVLIDEKTRRKLV